MLSLRETARIVEGVLRGPDSGYGMVEVDARRVDPMGLFVAIKGERFDGHDFVDEVCKKGGSGAIVSRHVSSSIGLIEVADSVNALKSLAKSWRSGFDLPVIAVTGSVGKTSIKNIIATVLGCYAPTLATKGNTNNQIGVPLNLLRLRKDHKYAVLELGINHSNEMLHLVEMCRPNIGIISNAGASHLEGIGSVEDVAIAKGQLIRGINKSGHVILNADDPHCEYWKSQASFHNVTTYGFRSDANVSGALSRDRKRLSIRYGMKQARLPVPVDPAVSSNVLAATAACIKSGLSLGQVAWALRHIKPTPGRLHRLVGMNDSLIIDDSYNANPLSVRAAISTLGAENKKRKILVLGDMKELGEEKELDYHIEVIEFLKKTSGIDLITVGDISAQAARSYERLIRSCSSTEQAVQILKPLLNKDSCVLIKGSRSIRTEKIAEAIKVVK